MISLIFIFLIIFPYVLNGKKNINSNDEYHFIIFASSLLIAYAILGILGLIFVFCKITFIPLYLILIFIFGILLFNREYRNQLKYTYNKIKLEIKNYIFVKPFYKSKIIIYTLLILLLISSIGPINHSDTANIYVGYPYQFLRNNSHFIDGNLNQGLIGIGDFANIFYFQDHTTWLIRTSQFLPLIFLVPLMIKRNTSNLIIILFLSSPVFLQWLTIGKNNFLSESCLAIAFLVWEKNKEKRYLDYLLSIMLIAFSFKISSLIVSLPILIYIMIEYRYTIINFRFKDILNSNYLILFIGLLSIILIFSYRYYLIDNPFYPLFSEIFNNGDQQLLDWENTLRNWDRNGLFPLWIFIPKTLGRISFVLGPANLILFLGILSILFKDFKRISNRYLISILQILMLFMFSQGRADYYMAPLIIMTTGTKVNIFESIFSEKKIIYKTIKLLLKYALCFQLLMFSVSSFYFISMNAITFFNYERGMDKTAYNFFNSKIIQNQAQFPVYNEFSGITKLFFNQKYISDHSFNRCLYYSKFANKKNKYER